MQQGQPQLNSPPPVPQSGEYLRASMGKATELWLLDVSRLTEDVRRTVLFGSDEYPSLVLDPRISDATEPGTTHIPTTALTSKKPAASNSSRLLFTSLRFDYAATATIPSGP